MRFMTIPSGLSGAFAVGAVLAAAGDTPPLPGDGVTPFQLEAFRWSGELRRGAALVARNDYGELHVQESSDGELLVSAMIQKIGGDAEQLVVEVRPAEARVEVGVRAIVADVRGRVDVTLMVPDGRYVDLTTTAGDIRIQEFGGRVKARSQTGSISAMRVRALDAETEGGGVSVALLGRRFRSPILLRGRGDVSVLVSAAASLDVEAQAPSIEVSLPAERLRDVVESPGRYEARLGDGGVSLHATSVAGRVRIESLR
jgi:hypothetical protein